MNRIKRATRLGIAAIALAGLTAAALVAPPAAYADFPPPAVPFTIESKQGLCLGHKADNDRVVVTHGACDPFNPEQRWFRTVQGLNNAPGTVRDETGRCISHLGIMLRASTCNTVEGNEAHPNRGFIAWQHLANERVGSTKACWAIGGEATDRPNFTTIGRLPGRDCRPHHAFELEILPLLPS